MPVEHWSHVCLMLWDSASGHVPTPLVTLADRNEAKRLRRMARQILRALHAESPWTDWWWWIRDHFEGRTMMWLGTEEGKIDAFASDPAPAPAETEAEG